MSKRLTMHELEQLRDAGFPRDKTPRARLLSVVEVLRLFTDEDSGLSASEIARAIGELTGKEPSENTVLADLHAISSFEPFGMKIAIPSHGENTGFRCIQKHLSSEEAILVGDVIRASSFIDMNTKRKLCEKLYGLSSIERFDQSLETVYVDERDGFEASETLEAICLASKAILKKRQIIFRVSTRWMNGKIAKTSLIQEDPVAIIFSFGRFYLETVARHRETGLLIPMFRRIDLLCDLQLSRKPFAFPEKVKELSTTIIKDTREKIDMFGDGVTRSLFLKVDGASAKYVYDRFGHNINFQHIRETEDSVTGYAHVSVQLGPTFYRWLFGHGGGVFLERPKSIKWVKQFDGCNNIDRAGLTGLVEDYEIACEGYRHELEKALETTGKDWRDIQ